MSQHQPDENYDEKIEKMVTMTVAGAKGIVPLAQVALPLAQIAKGNLAPPDVRDFARSLSRILQGERDPQVLNADLTPEFTDIIDQTLDQIEAPLPELDETRQELTFEQLVEKVAEACTGNLLLWQQLWQFTQELAADQRVPPEVRTLGTALHKILAGERQNHILADLSPQHHWAIEQLLDWLNDQAITPDSPHLPT